MEEVDELAITLWHEIIQDISHRIVYPMHQNARNKTLGTIIHPSQKQAHQEGIDKLRLIAMYQAKHSCRNEDGNPMILLAYHIKQSTEDSTTEHDFLCQRCQYTDSYIAPRLLHQRSKYPLGIRIHLDAYLLIDKLQRNDSAQSKQSYPQQTDPRL